MSGTLDKLSRLITARPWLTLAFLVAATVVLGAGAVFRAPPTEGADVAFLPPGHPMANAVQEINELFGDSGEVRVVTLIFRGKATPLEGLTQMDALLTVIAEDPDVVDLLAAADPIIAPSEVVKGILDVEDFTAVTPIEIAKVSNSPEIQELVAAVAETTGMDTDGTPVAIAVVRLRDTGDDQVAEAERRINELAVADEGLLNVSSLSPVIIEDEYKQATESGMGPLLGLALLLIAGLLVLFTRAIWDMALTLLGLILSIVWVVGAEGWLGPNGLGLIGPPSSLTAMVPVIIISLTVDYAIQAISHYREQRAAGEPVLTAVRVGFRNVSVPVMLAAATTMVSLLAGLLSPIGVIGDFGIVAALGVGMSLIVMLTLIPAGRTVIDRRRESRGTLQPVRPIANALPGIPRAAELLGRWVTRWPALCLIGVALISIGLGYAATGLKSEFSIRDILPRGGSVAADLDTLEAAVGGSTEVASVLVKAEVTETRTLLNLQDLAAAFEDEARRPGAAAGPIVASYQLIADDWIHDSGTPGDKYDPELATLFQEASVGVGLDPTVMQEFIDNLMERDPAVGDLLVNNPQGIDTMLIQFPAYSGDPKLAKALQEDIEALWFGDDEAITATSESVIAVTVTDAITERQTEAISATVAVALGVLAVFFWVTLRQPALAVVAVGPIVLVLIWVLGTMALLGIPYSLVTSIITALSIGIGVDYTIHVIHRYREEYTRTRNPEQAAIHTLSTTGSALLGSALTTAFGFGVLIASPLLASQQFGITATITIVYSLVVSVVVVLPAMVVWGAYQNMRLRAMVERMWNDLDVAIDDIQRRQ